MTIFQALLLGLVQGLTEFLPVSSSGHLVITQTFLGLSEPPILFDVIVHAGTLMAVIVFFYPRLKSITPKLAKLTIFATLPAVGAGLVIEPYLENIFSSLFITAIGLLCTAMFLLSTKLLKPISSYKTLTFRSAIFVGIFQALAIIPGISRSGSTVVAGLHSGLSKSEAFYFSFLLAIPAILGAQIIQLKNVEQINQLVNMPNIIGFVTAATSGLFALKLLRLVIDSTKLHLFGYYCLALGLSILAFTLSN